ncbi:TonB-dependent receptor [Dyadobacter psychrotolerans]|uniref:TonB-dependent receptor n=1 Tax=Dyadobacter psychrotolerans TaxID=2541721 RepID=A0A4R5DI85_9BACT|nr:TonB-dependent receptor [Dyadobacter psychrotolerans]TDE10465.1 TonB-dependent receptor [Dyadobacter psychrotolerans]
MKTPYLTILFCLIYLTAFAHQGTLQGFVYDAATKTPLKGASVHIAGTDFSAYTNDLGEFKIKNIDPGNYQVQISFIGFQSVIQSFKISDGETTSLTFNMTNGSIDLSEIKVQAPNTHTQQLISQIDIKLRPVNNSQEVLRMVPGLFIGQHAGGGKAEQIFLRGFDIDHGTDISIMADGMPVNMVSHAHGQGYADLHFVIPELIDNVAFKKGPYTAEKGNFATAGWVEFQTKDVLDRSFMKAELGQFDTYRALGTFDLLGDKQNRQSAYIAGEYNFSNSYFDSPQNFQRINGIAKYNAKIGDNSIFNASVSHFWSKWNHSGQIPDRAVESGLISHFGAIDDKEGGLTSRTNANLKLTTKTADGDIIKNQLFYSNYNFELFSNFTFFLVDPLNGDQIKQKEKRNLFGYNGSYSHTGYIGSKTLETSVGISYRQDVTNNTELSRTINRTTTTSALMLGDINEMNMGFYLNQTVNLTSQISLNASIRYDWFNNQYLNLLTAHQGKAHAGIVSPKVNLYYAPVKNIQLYVNVGKGFHSNDSRAGGVPLVVEQKGKDILPAAYGSDLGVNWKPIPKLYINAAAWYLWLKQEFVYVGDEGVVEPSGRTVRKGIDLTIRYQLANNLFFDTDLNVTKPRSIDEENGNDYIPLAPVFSSTGGFTYRKSNGWNGSLRYRYLGDRPANEDNSIVAKGYFIADALVNYTKSRYNIGLSVMNILNTKWKQTQFATESRLKNETEPVNEIHFTAGSPFFAKLSLTYYLK